MELLSPREKLFNLYGVMMEINLSRGSDEVWEELEKNPSERVDRHYAKIKILTARYKAIANRRAYEKAVEQIKAIKARGIDEFRKLFGPSQQSELVPLFRKFEELSSKDAESILEDQELLQVLATLNKKLQ